MTPLNDFAKLKIVLHNAIGHINFNLIEVGDLSCTSFGNYNAIKN